MGSKPENEAHHDAALRHLYPEHAENHRGANRATPPLRHPRPCPVRVLAQTPPSHARARGADAWRPRGLVRRFGVPVLAALLASRVRRRRLAASHAMAAVCVHRAALGSAQHLLRHPRELAVAGDRGAAGDSPTAGFLMLFAQTDTA